MRKLLLISILAVVACIAYGNVALDRGGVAAVSIAVSDGLGGFEAIVPGPELFCPIISDARGNLLAVNDPKHGGLLWNASRPTGYGAVPGYRPPALGHGRTLVESSALGGRWISTMGFYLNFLRPLVADIGQWASADPAGHGASDNLMTYANGDPINITDTDGLCGVDRAVIGSGLDDHTPINQFVGNSQYLSTPGAPDRIAQNFMRCGEFGLPSDYAHSYQNVPVTPMDSLSVPQFGSAEKEGLLASAVNALTMGMANSASVAFTGYDLWGKGDPYDTRTRWAEGVQFGAAFVPLAGEGGEVGLRFASRLTGLFERGFALRAVEETPALFRNAPSGFSNGNLGAEAHANFESALNDLYGTQKGDWFMRTAPGQTGVDATFVGDLSRYPGFTYGELKPYSQSSLGTFGNQLGNWGLPAGQTELFFYNPGGIIGSSGFRF